MGSHGELLRRTAELAIDYLDGVAARPVGRPVDADSLRIRLGGDLPEGETDPLTVVERLAAAADPGLVASAGPRYFGFVIGGSLPAAVGADWLTSAWDQNAGLYVSSPAASVIEETAGRWILDLLGLPASAGFGFTTGATMANLSALAAARHAVLGSVGWDVEARGLSGAPPIRVVTAEESHVTIYAALRLLGLGSETVRVGSDVHGRMDAQALAAALAPGGGPTIVCAQAGNVNTGAFDPLVRIAALTREAGAWLHVDGAFGLWAGASPARRELVAGVADADSWTTDAHKWLNVPYDCGFVAVRDPATLAASMALVASYLLAADRERDPFDWVPEASRRARANTVYAAIASLGRSGIAGMVDRCCDLARRMADRLDGQPGVRVLNDVVLNQVLVRFEADSEDDAAGDARTRAVIAAVQRDGTCWAGGTTRVGRAAMRISVSSWNTTEEDIDRSAAAILRCARETTPVPA